MLVHNFEQGTEEWFAVRRGKFTASDAQAIAAAGKGLETLVFEKAAEILSNERKESYTNDDIERGILLEAEARRSYEIMTGKSVEVVGFIELTKFRGCSPDGLVGKDGMIEIKCPSDAVFVRYLYDKKIDPKYLAQMQMQMGIAGRKWVDYVVYNPHFENSTIIVRVLRDEYHISKIDNGLDAGETMLRLVLGAIK